MILLWVWMKTIFAHFWLRVWVLVCEPYQGLPTGNRLAANSKFGEGTPGRGGALAPLGLWLGVWMEILVESLGFA